MMIHIFYGMDPEKSYSNDEPFQKVGEIVIAHSLSNYFSMFLVLNYLQTIGHLCVCLFKIIKQTIYKNRACSWTIVGIDFSIFFNRVLFVMYD